MGAPGTTPGPWSVNPNTFHEPVIRARNGYAVAVAKVDFGGCSNSSEKDAALNTRKANAHLIAAAPELYEMLAMFAHAAKPRGPDGFHEMPRFSAKEIQLVQATLAKARGEQS